MRLWWRGGRVLGETVEVGAGELPLERLGDLLVAATEREELLLERGEVGEVVGREHLALHDREVDLGLVGPNWRGPGCGQGSGSCTGLAVV